MDWFQAIEDEKRGLSWTILIASIASIQLGILGAVLSLTRFDNTVATILLGISLLLATAAPAMAHWTRLMPLIRPKGIRSERRDELAQWQSLKVLGITLNLVGSVALIAVILLALTGTGMVAFSQGSPLVADVPAFLAMALIVLCNGSLLQSMRLSLTKRDTALAEFYHYMTLAVSAILATWAILAATGTIPLASGAGDQAMLLMVAAGFIALNLFIDRPIPTLAILFAEDKGAYQGTTHFKRSKSVIAPTLGAFALLMLVFLLFVTVSGGLTGVWSRVTSDARLLVMTLGAVLVLIASAAGAIVLVRTSDDLPKIKKRADPEAVMKMSIIGGSAVAALILTSLAIGLQQGSNIFGMGRGRWTDLLALAIMAALGPYGFYVARRAKRIRELEERFPDFLRDLGSSHRGGLTLPAAVSIAARGEYGQLTSEIARISDQMSWNVSFAKALERFGERVRTPLVERAVNLILQADRSGGNTSDVLLAAARDARHIKELENERMISMTLYTVVIYVTFGVFLLVTAIMYGQFIPEIIFASEATAEQHGSRQIQAASLFQYRAFYHISAISQGVGSGIIAGMMGTGSAILGLRHSFLMVLTAAVTFGFFL